MAKASKYFGASGGGIALGQVIYLNVKDIDITISGSRYLRSGFVETDLTSIDPAIVTDGALFEKEIDNAVSSNGNVWKISENGTVLRTNGTTVERTTDNGATWNTSTIALPANYNHQDMATDGAGTWVVCQGRGNVGYPPTYKVSTDDGITFTTLSGVPTTAFDSEVHVCRYSPETGEWLIFHWGDAVGTASRACISTDLVSWSVYNTSFISAGFLIVEPCEGNNTWYFHGRSGNSATDYGRVYILNHGLSSFTNISSANGDTHTNGMFSYMYFINGNLYCGTGDKPGTNFDYSLLHKFPPVPANYSDILDTKRYDDTDYPRIQEGGSGKYFNGAVYLLNGYVTYNGYDMAFHDQGNVPSGIYETTSTNLYKSLDSTDDDANHIYKNVRSVGLGTAFSQGAVSQFMKIQENV